MPSMCDWGDSGEHRRMYIHGVIPFASCEERGGGWEREGSVVAVV